MSASADAHVVEDRRGKRFEVLVGNEVVGFAEYIPLPGKVIVTHTEVDERFEGQGLGGRLAAGALELLRADGRVVQPLCPFFSEYLRRHPEFDDVVDPTTPH